jgi:hypothetical protein
VTRATTNYGYDYLIPPTNETVQAGSLATFSVSASVVDAPSFGYQWYFDGNVLSGATNSTLTLEAVSSNAGNYTVVISNHLGSVTSAVVTLTVPGGSSNSGEGPLPSWAIILFGAAVFAIGAKYIVVQQPSKAPSGCD